jgi:hypothetical protein
MISKELEHEQHLLTNCANAARKRLTEVEQQATTLRENTEP